MTLDPEREALLSERFGGSLRNMLRFMSEQFAPMHVDEPVVIEATEFHPDAHARAMVGWDVDRACWRVLVPSNTTMGEPFIAVFHEIAHVVLHRDHLAHGSTGGITAEGWVDRRTRLAVPRAQVPADMAEASQDTPQWKAEADDWAADQAFLVLWALQDRPHLTAAYRGED